jgi:hypothetical protein
LCPYRSRKAAPSPRAFADLADEADALALHRADQALRLAAVADGLAHGVDAAGQRRFGHDAPVPDRCDQVILADHAVAIAHQMDQQVEHLRLDGDGLAGAPQLAPIHVKDVIIKEKLQVGPTSNGSILRQ